VVILSIRILHGKLVTFSVRRKFLGCYSYLTELYKEDIAVVVSFSSFKMHLIDSETATINLFYLFSTYYLFLSKAYVDLSVSYC